MVGALAWASDDDLAVVLLAGVISDKVFVMDLGDAGGEVPIDRAVAGCGELDGSADGLDFNLTLDDVNDPDPFEDVRVRVIALLAGDAHFVAGH